MDIYAENGALQARIMTGTAIPDGTSNGQDTAPIGSLYLRSGTGGTYEKIANAGAPADWILIGSGWVLQSAENYQKYLIPTGETHTIPQGVSSVITGPLELEGILELNGRLEVL